MPPIELPDPTALTDGDLRLRPPADADVDAITAACQDPDLQRFTRVPVPYERRHAEHYVTMARDGLAEGSALLLLAVDANDGRLLGTVGLEVDQRDLTGELGYWVVAEARGRGVATRGSRLLCRVAFDRLGLAYLALHAAATNPASNAVAARLGFTHEGTSRDAMLDGPAGDHTAPRCTSNLWGLRPDELGPA